ncbi:Deoxyhypusine hydroxylase [Hypsibius exemplaris]|uniref:Deoxyhypusine hydroxylase n=1 Tax=Hypsibius exemplaris TaxID=2072580 RepID=A0A1W0WG56_HYPEX|nr:Deoxyhypusine hydroxylase [Hypsibius exemplaris]
MTLPAADSTAESQLKDDFSNLYERIGKILTDQAKPMKERFRALFTLRNLGGARAVDLIAGGFTDPSALLKHECAYCLGQMKDRHAVDVLISVLEDLKQEPIVRHEAGEALAAIADPRALSVLEKYKNDPSREVAETCQLALERLKWMEENPSKLDLLTSQYLSIDPAPCSEETDIPLLEAQLLNEKETLFNRYRAMFSLRNIGSKEAVKALAKGLQAGGPLFRHEIAYVLGQVQSDVCVPELSEGLSDARQDPMVRHECADALGSIADEYGTKMLQSGDFVEDFRQIVRTVGIAPEEAPKLINKTNFSLWRNVELLPPPAPVVVASRLSELALQETVKATKGGGGAAAKAEPSFKSSLMDSSIKSTKDKGGKDKEKGKKKASKITGKTDQPPVNNPDQKASPSTDGQSRSPSSLEATAFGKKPAGRMATAKGFRDQKDSSKGKDDSGNLDAIPVVEGTNMKPLQVVYEAYTQNRLKEMAIRYWAIDRQVLDLLCKCWVVCDKLTTLILIDCGLKSTDLIQLSDVLPKIVNLDLRSLSLRYANLDDRAMQNLANSWRLIAREWSPERPGLEFLDLSRNKITDRGLEYLIQALRFNRSLTTLALPGNHITDYGIELLCNCLFTRFLLTKEELLERRTKKAYYIPPVINPAIYNLKRRFRHGNDVASVVKGRVDKEEKKKDKDESKKPSTRLSGARVSAGNAVKTRGASARSRTSPAASQLEKEKHGLSVVKTSSQKLTPSVGAVPHAPKCERDDASDSKADHFIKESVHSRVKPTPGGMVKKLAGAATTTELSDDAESVASGSHHGLTDNLSLLDVVASDKRIGGSTSQDIQPVMLTSSTDGLFSELTGPLDSRVTELLAALRRLHHTEIALSDFDVWLDRAAQSRESHAARAEMAASHGMDWGTFHEMMATHRGLYAHTDKTAAKYQALLIEYCQNVVSGKADILDLPPQIQDNLLRFCENPFFMFEDDKDEQRKKRLHQQQQQEIAIAASAVVSAVSTPIIDATSPRFHLQVTAASLIGLEAKPLLDIPVVIIQEAHSTTDATQKSDTPDLGAEMLPPQIMRTVSPDVDLMVPSAPAVASNKDTVKLRDTSANTRLSTGINRSSARSATPGHRKLSLGSKKARTKRAGDVDAQTVDPPKECPFFSVVPSEEKFDALIDGVLYCQDGRLISDGNRTLKVLNLMSNKITTVGAYNLMEVVSKQREEQSLAFQWERPRSPDVAMPKPPPAVLTVVNDTPESETIVVKKEPPPQINRQDDRQTVTKRTNLKRPAADNDSVTPNINADEASGDECSPIIVHTRTVKDNEDPNRLNLGLLYVDIENKDLDREDITYKVFARFMKQQRESYGVASKSSLEQILHAVPVGPGQSGEDVEEERIATNLRKLPTTDLSQYTLLKSQYMMEKKSAPAPP